MKGLVARHTAGLVHADLLTFLHWCPTKVVSDVSIQVQVVLFVSLVGRYMYRAILFSSLAQYDKLFLESTSDNKKGS